MKVIIKNKSVIYYLASGLLMDTGTSGTGGKTCTH
jgi:hypothetical protein